MTTKGSALFQQILKSATPEERLFITHSMQIARSIGDVLRQRGMTQRDLAVLTHKRDSEVSKWLSGSHNFTIRTLCLIEASLNVRLFTMGYEQPRYDVGQPWDDDERLVAEDTPSPPPTRARKKANRKK